MLEPIQKHNSELGVIDLRSLSPEVKKVKSMFYRTSVDELIIREDTLNTLKSNKAFYLQCIKMITLVDSNGNIIKQVKAREIGL